MVATDAHSTTNAYQSAGSHHACAADAATARQPENAVVSDRYPRNTSARAICWRISAICVSASCSSMGPPPAEGLHALYIVKFRGARAKEGPACGAAPFDRNYRQCT